MPLYDKRLDVVDASQNLIESTMVDMINIESDATEEMLKIGENMLRTANVVEGGETVIMMAGRLSGLGLSSSVIVWTVGEKIPHR